MHKDAKINVQKLIKNKNRDFYLEKVREMLVSPRKALKSLRLPSKITPVSEISL